MTNQCSDCAKARDRASILPSASEERENTQRWLRETVRPALLANKTIEWIPLYVFDGYTPKPWRWGQSKKPFLERHDELGHPAGTGVILGEFEWEGEDKEGTTRNRSTTVLLREDRPDGSPIAPIGSWSDKFQAYSVGHGGRYNYQLGSVHLRYGGLLGKLFSG